MRLLIQVSTKCLLFNCSSFQIPQLYNGNIDKAVQKMFTEDKKDI